MVTAEDADREGERVRVKKRANRDCVLTCAEIGAAEADRGEGAPLERHCPHRPEGVGGRKERTMAQTCEDTKNRSHDELEIIQKVKQRHA